MASDVSRDYYQGLILEREGCTINAALSSATQAGPRTGRPSPSRPAGLVLEGHGTQAASSDLTIAAHTSGGPGTARLRWMQTAGTDWYGRDLPVAATSWRVPVPLATFGGATLVSMATPHAVGLPDGDAACVYHAVWAASVYEGVRCITYDESAGTYTDHQVWRATAGTLSHDPHPCLVRLPSGRLLCYSWSGDSTGNRGQIRMDYSDDGGSTWALGSKGVIPGYIDLSVAGSAARRLRAAAFAGTVLLLVCYDDGSRTSVRATVQQYASADGGATFSYITEAQDVVANACVACVDCVATHRGITVIGAPVATGTVYSETIGTAFEPLSLVVSAIAALITPDVGDLSTSSGTGPTLLVQDEASLCAEPDGRLWLYARRYDGGTDDQCIVATSADGTEWDWIRGGALGSSADVAAWWYSGTSGVAPTAFSASYSGARAMMWATCETTSGTCDAQVMVTPLGGWSQVTWPQRRAYDTDEEVSAPTGTWWAMEDPASAGWTLAGTPTTSLGVKWSVSTAAAQGYWYRSIPTTTGRGYIVLAELDITSGGSVSGGTRSGIRIEIQDASAGIDVDVAMDATDALAIWDRLAGAGSGSVQMDPGPWQVMIAADTTKVLVWWRPRDQATDREWTLAIDYTPTTGAVANDRVSFGHFGAQTTASEWYLLDVAAGTDCGQQLTGASFPDDLRAHLVGPHPVYVAEGASVAAVGGIAQAGDTWTVQTEYDYPLSALLEGSPRSPWRSTSRATQTIIIDVDPVSYAKWPTPIFGIAVLGSNVGRIHVEGYTTGGSWFSLGTTPRHVARYPLTYTRGGSTVEVTSTIDQGGIDSMQGHRWSYGSGTGRPVIGSSTLFPQPHLVHLSDAESGDPASGSYGAIIPDQWALIGAIDTYAIQRIRLTIYDDATSVVYPPEPYWTIGRIIIGPVYLAPDATSWGRSIETRGGSSVVYATDRTARALLEAPGQRVVEIDWSDGVDTTNIMGDGFGVNAGTPDYITAWSSYRRHGHRGATPADIEGIVRRYGASRLVCYLPRIVNGVTSSALYRSRDSMVVGRISADVRLDTIQGDEGIDEVVRIPTLTITEEV